MSTESATIEAPNGAVPPNSASEFEARFAEAKAAEAAPVTETPEVTPPTTEAKPPVEQDIPDELISGKKPDAKPDLQKTELDKLLEAEPPAHYSAVQKSNWAKLKEATKQAQQEAAKFREELESTRAKVGQPSDLTAKELEELRKAVAERDELIERTAYEKSPAFQRFEVKEKRAIEQAKAYLEGSEIDPSVVERAANLSGAKRINVLKEAGLDSETIAAITPYLASLDDTRAEKNGALENWKVNAERHAQEAKIQAERAEQQAMEKETNIMKEMFKTAAERWGAYQKVEGQDAWNQRVEGRLPLAIEYLQGAKPLPELCDIILAGLGAQDTQTINDRLRAQNKELHEKVKSLSSVQPDGGTVNGTPKPTVSQRFDPAQSASEFDQRLRGG